MKDSNIMLFTIVIILLIQTHQRYIPKTSGVCEVLLIEEIKRIVDRKEIFRIIFIFGKYVSGNKMHLKLSL